MRGYSAQRLWEQWPVIPPPPPTLRITSGVLPAGTFSVAYGASGAGFTLTATGGTAPYTWNWTAAAGSSLPPGLGLFDNQITGAPSALGSFNVIVTVTDSATPPKENSSPYTITVTVGKLVITTGSFPSGLVGSRYNPVCVRKNGLCVRIAYGLQLQASGGVPAVPGYTWSWAAATGSSLPPGLDLPAGGRLDGTPTLAGSYHVVVTVNDAQVPPAQTSANFTLVVNNPPPPSISTDPPPSAAAVNLPYAFTFLASGFKPFTWSERGALPPGLAFGTDGKLAGTPTALGSYPISVTVTDAAGQESATDDVAIEVFPHGFKATASMNSIRSSHRATLLNDGRVLVTGGADTGGTVLAAAEMYNPAIGSFATTGDMKETRAYHTATLLNNGKVLVTGGGDTSGVPSSTAELFDPATGTFVLTGSMGAARTGHTATLLSNGKVLVTGGLSDTAELFDPTTGTFTATGKMSAVRTSHTATVLANGKVLVTGGVDANVGPLATADLYDPATGSFTSTGSMATARSGHTATLLLDGRVLVAGGVDGVTAELFDPVSGTFGRTGSMRTARNSHTAVLLTDGTMLVTGGYEHPDTGPALALAEIFNETGGSFAGTGSLITGRSRHTATRLLNGQVLVTGGLDVSGGALATAELYQ